MPSVNVQATAATKDRSLLRSSPQPKRLFADPPLKFWRWLINSALADAKKTVHGMPTDSALLSRWWIEEHRANPKDKQDYKRSFESACGWLSLDVEAERKRLLKEIDDVWSKAYLHHVRKTHRQLLQVRREAVLTVAGTPSTRALMLVSALVLISESDYEHVADIEYGDPVGAKRVLAERGRRAA